MNDPSSGRAADRAADRLRVLVIDDDPLFRQLVVSLLRSGFDTAVAEDGETGYGKALAWRPHLVLIDQRMPGWDGLLTLRKLRAHPSLANVKTLMLTADAGRETVLAAIRYGVNDYVVKTSFTREELWAKVGMLLGRRGDLPVPPPSAIDQPAPSSSENADAGADADADAATIAVLAAAVATAPPAASLQQIIDDWE